MSRISVGGGMNINNNLSTIHEHLRKKMASTSLDIDPASQERGA